MTEYIYRLTHNGSGVYVFYTFEEMVRKMTAILRERKEQKPQLVYLSGLSGGCGGVSPAFLPGNQNGALVYRLLDGRSAIFFVERMASVHTETPVQEKAPDAFPETQKPRGLSKRAEPDEESFSKFWAAYPKKAGKADARKAFAKLRPDKTLLQKILSAIEIQKKSRQWQDGQYIPYPATWLNGGRWEDETEPFILPEEKEHSYDLSGYEALAVNQKP